MPPGLVHSIRGRVAIANPVSHTIGCTGLTLGTGMGMGLLRLRLRLILDKFYHHAPQHTAPGCVRFSLALRTIIGVPFALAAHEADRLTIPIVHEVERNAARQI